MKSIDILFPGAAAVGGGGGGGAAEEQVAPVRQQEHRAEREEQAAAGGNRKPVIYGGNMAKCDTSGTCTPSLPAVALRSKLFGLTFKGMVIYENSAISL